VTLSGRLSDGDWVATVGDPALAPALVERGMSVCATAASIAELQHARSADKNATVLWVQQDPQRLGLVAGVWRAIVISRLGTDIASPVSFLRECFGLLAPGGSLMVRHQPHDQLAEIAEYGFFPAALEIATFRTPDTPQIRSWLEEAGCARVRTNSVELRAPHFDAKRVQKVRRRELWTLALIDEDEFQRGLTALEEHAIMALDDPALLLESGALTYGRKRSPRRS
jgi:hypothetical protein